MRIIRRTYKLKGQENDNHNINSVDITINNNKKSKNYGTCSSLEFDCIKSLRENPLNTTQRNKKLHIAMLILEEANYSKIFTSKN